FFDRAGRAESAAYLREAERLAGSDYQSMILVADGLASEGYVERAIRYLDGVDSDRPEVTQYLAELEELRGRPKACVGRARSLEPDSRTLRRIARCESKRGRRAEAFSAIREMVRRGLASDAAVREAALVASWSPKLEEARRVFRRFVGRGEFDPREVQLAEATISDHFGAGDDAIARIESLARDDETTLRLADLYARYGQFERGVAMLQSMVDEAPRNAARLNALGFTLIDADGSKELKRAEILIRRAYRLSLDAGYVTDSLGWLRYQQGALEDAKRLLERALKLDGAEAEVLWHYGDVLRALGDEEAARESYASALALNPSSSIRQVLEKRLKIEAPERVRSSRRTPRRR
ncbi:MAG: tetratricopeptide repeat protein, partial [Myxococcota bacterium]